MAIAIALSGFNDLGRSVTSIVLLMDQFLYRFSTFSQKIKKKSIDWKFELFAKCTIEFRSFQLSVCRVAVQMPLKRLSFVTKTQQNGRDSVTVKFGQPF